MTERSWLQISSTTPMPETLLMNLLWFVKSRLICNSTACSSGVTYKRRPHFDSAKNKLVKLYFILLAGSGKNSASHGQRLQHPQPERPCRRLQDQPALQHRLQGLRRAPEPHGRGEHDQRRGYGAGTPCRPGHIPSCPFQKLEVADTD